MTDRLQTFYDCRRPLLRMGNRTIALAVDGMEPSLLDKWFSDGELPNMAEVAESGARGTASCSSLSSAKQWTTHFTGVAPEVHGVEGFLRADRQRSAGEDAPEAAELINRSDIETATYPELLAERDRSVGLLNPLPLWPPFDFDDGFCVSGMLTPPSSDDWVRPDHLGSELEALDYRIDVRYGDRPYGFVDDRVFEDVSLSELEADLFDLLDARIEATKYLLREYPVDFLYVLLKSIDVFQHCFWLPMVKSAEGSSKGNTILEAYRRVDDLVGWLREMEDVNLVMFSDHGFKTRPAEPTPVIGPVARWINDRIAVPEPAAAAYQVLFGGDVDVDLESINQITGVHADPAAVIMAGPDVKSVDHPVNDADFEDITPTILTLLDEPIPEAYVGSPLTRLLHREPRYEDVDLSVRRDPAVGEADVISERLHNLGYAEMVDE